MQKHRLIGKLASVIILSAVAALALSPTARAGRPLLVLYELIPTDEANKTSAEEATRLVKLYLRNAGRVDVLQIRADMPSVKLAISEGRVTQEEVSKLSDPDVRRKLTQAIGAQYALGGAISVKGEDVTIVVELLDMQSDKKWPAASSIKVTGGDPAKGLANAMQSSANTVARQLDSQAFNVLPKTTVTPPSTEDKVEDTSAPATNEANARAARAKKLMEEGNIAGAIYELRRAIQIAPENPDLRLLLAKAYIPRGMLDEASREISKAAQLGLTGDDLLTTMASLYEAKGTPGEIIPFYEQMISKKPEDVTLRIKLGDLLWRKAKIDDAIKNFEAAAVVDPKSVAILDRLARCYAAKSLFDESLKRLDMIAKLESPPDPAGVASRYAALMVIVEGEVRSISNQFDQGAKAYENEEHTREQYYEQIRGLTDRADTLTRFLDKVPVPNGVATAHSHRVLACSLLSQAGTSLMSFLETNKEESQTESQLYLSEAKKELSLASAPPPAPKPPATPATPTASVSTTS